MSGARRAASDAELCAFLDGEIASERREEIETWIATHPDASARLAAWRRQAQMLHAAYDGIAQKPLPDFLTSPLPEHRVAPFPHAVGPLHGGEPPLELAPQPSAGIAGRRWSALRAFAFALLALAVVLGLLASGFLHVITGPAPNQPVALTPAPGLTLMRRASEAHLAFAHFGPERLDEKGGSAAVLAQRAGLGMRMPEAPAPYQPLGLRLVPGEKEIAGLVIFEDGKGGRMGLYAARTDAPAAPAIVLRESEGLASGLFMQKGVAYVVTGRMTRAQMLDLASALRESLR